ncbi:MAG: hypothetical protein V3S24_18820, partial [Candidatus Tectomicrobia bacterium]
KDGLACARYFDEAAEGFMRLVFGRRFEYIIATAFTQPGHDPSPINEYMKNLSRLAASIGHSRVRSIS